jgi:16S rRNA C967 or C1407 C5-methylase (RsmB/RsmF family)
LEPEENELVIQSFLNSHPDASLGVPEMLSIQKWLSASKFLNLFPPETQTDGFFAAVIRKNNS